MKNKKKIQAPSAMTEEERHKHAMECYRSYVEERNGLVASSLAASERFDKWVIGLPTGAIGLTIVFYEKIASKADPQDFHLLACSWIALSASIAFGYASLYFSTLAIGRQIEMLDDSYNSTPISTSETLGKNENQEQANNWSKATASVNLIALITAIAGIALFLWFACAIINPTVHKKDENTPANRNEQSRACPSQKPASPAATSPAATSPAATAD